jgi:hypothetical protein
MITRLQRASLLVVLAVAGSMYGYAQDETPFTLEAKSVMASVAPGGFAEFEVKVTNTFVDKINVRIVRTKNDLPNADWNSAICTGVNCFPATFDTVPGPKDPPFALMAGTSGESKLTVVVGSQPNVTGHIILQYDTGDDTPSQTLEFTVSVTSGSSDVPQSSDLSLGLYPNPTTGRTHYNYSLPKGGDVSIEISSLTGSRLLAPVSEYQAAGDHSLDLDLAPLPNGVYVVTLTANGVKNSKLVTVAR